MNGRPVDQPRPGFFKMRLVRGGPFVGAEIRYGPARDPETGGIMEERSWLWETWINGRLVRDPSPDPVAAGVYRVWHSGLPIDDVEYRFLIADRDWCAKHAPHRPEATPDRKPDIGALTPEDFRP